MDIPQAIAPERNFIISQRERSVEIIVKRRNYKCNNCAKTFQDSMPEMPDNRKRLTKRLRWYIVVQILIRGRIFKSIAAELGIDNKTVSNAFSDYMTAPESMRSFKAPKVMGIKSISVGNKPHLAIFDIRKNNNTIIDLLEGDNEQSLTDYFKVLPHEEKNRVEFAVIDLNVPRHKNANINISRINAIRSALPNATIVIDKAILLKEITDFCARKASTQLSKENRHLVSIFDKRRNALNSDENKQLNEWSTSLKTVSDLYEFKEQFYDIWLVNDKHAASRRYWTLQEATKQSENQKELFNKINTCASEIFNYFDLPFKIKNPKKLINRIDEINRLGKGYSFEVLRARLMFDLGLTYATDEYGFKKGSKQATLFSLLWAGQHTRQKIIAGLDKKYSGINNKRDLTTFISDLKKPFGTYPHSRGVKVCSAENGILFISFD